MIVQLLTYSGPVGRVEIPPFKKLPEVLVWGTRTFVLDMDATVLQSSLPAHQTPIYREGCAFYVTGRLLPDGTDSPLQVSLHER